MYIRPTERSDNGLGLSGFNPGQPPTAPARYTHTHIYIYICTHTYTSIYAYIRIWIPG